MLLQRSALRAPEQSRLLVGNTQHRSARDFKAVCLSSPRPDSRASNRQNTPVPPQAAVATETLNTANQQQPPQQRDSGSRSHETDYVVVGSGIGGEAAQYP